ncbi:OmpA family protein [Marinilabiliaceae bacterium ANBcel2]|nr:OmpA family protein [Marinilabiliaceae bacterium ANBcel2]
MKLTKFTLFITIITLSVYGCKSLRTVERPESASFPADKIDEYAIKEISESAASVIDRIKTDEERTSSIMKSVETEVKNKIAHSITNSFNNAVIIEINNNMLFNPDQYNIASHAESDLNNLISILNRHSNTNVEVHGHSDNSREASYNQIMTERKANSVSAFLIENGITSNRVKTRGMGENYPRYINDNEKGKTLNNRIEIIVTPQ